MEAGPPHSPPESFLASGHLFCTDDDHKDGGHGKMRPAWMNVWLVAALMLLLGVVPLPQMVFAGNSTVITEQQWERVQQKQQLIRERFEPLLQLARAQRELMMTWHKKARCSRQNKRANRLQKWEKRRLRWQYPDESRELGHGLNLPHGHDLRVYKSHTW